VKRGGRESASLFFPASGGKKRRKKGSVLLELWGRLRGLWIKTIYSSLSGQEKGGEKKKEGKDGLLTDFFPSTAEGWYTINSFRLKKGKRKRGKKISFITG